MSKVQLAGNANGTGIFTIASPNSNTDRTLTLPDNTGTLLSSSSTANFPSGSVLQVVSAQFNLGESTTSITFVASSVTASITPRSTSSRIYYIFTFNHQATGPSAPTGAQSAIFRNSSTNLTVNGSLGALIYSSAAANIHHEVTLQGVDSPSSTSPVTYTLYHARLDGLGTTTSEIRNWGKAFVTLMEIAG